MKVNRVIETSLYVSDLARSIEFYEKLFGFEKLISDGRFCAFSVSGETVLLLFQKGTTNEPARTPAGVIPPHNGNGELHVAFSIDSADADAWRERLAANDIPIESTAHWPRGGRSLYFRDPDRHLLELITPGCWAIY